MNSQLLSGSYEPRHPEERLATKDLRMREMGLEPHPAHFEILRSRPPDPASLRMTALTPAPTTSLRMSDDLLGRSGSDEVSLEQLEAFFRRNLARVVQLRSSSSQVPEVPGEVADGVGAMPRRWPVASRSDVARPAAGIQPGIERQSSVPRKIERMTDQFPKESSDFRRTPRYTPPSPLEGTFGELRFSILEISTSGLRIRHTPPLDAGKEGKLSFTLTDPAQTFNLRGRVVWTTAATFTADSGEPSHVSGVRVIDAGNRLENLIKTLSAASSDETDEEEVGSEISGAGRSTVKLGVAAEDEPLRLV
jgi:PilZ domain